MLTAPATIAARPSPNSRECWKPAVPPPPVAGAVVENGLGVGEGLGAGLAVGVIVGLADGVGVGTLAVLLGALVGAPDPVAPGEMDGGDAAGGDPEQAETAAEANMAKAAQPKTANLALRPVPRVVLRIFMAPPHDHATRSARPGEDGRVPQRFAVPVCRRATPCCWPQRARTAREDDFLALRPRGIVWGKNRGKGDLIAPLA
jgi:hypothetical protein